MAIVLIEKSLEDEIHKKFKKESVTIFSLMYELKSNPKKGKPVGVVGNILIKELKYKKFRFYFIVNKYKIKFLKIDELKDLLIKFIRMSEKNDQDDVIKEIKRALNMLQYELD